MSDVVIDVVGGICDVTERRYHEMRECRATQDLIRQLEADSSGERGGRSYSGRTKCDTSRLESQRP